MKHLALLLLFTGLSLRVAAFEVVVAQDGSGDFTALQAAINAVPDHADERSVIHIRNGVYDQEKLIIPESKRNITFLGENREQTIISYHCYNGISPDSKS